MSNVAHFDHSSVMYAAILVTFAFGFLVYPLALTPGQTFTLHRT